MISPYETSVRPLVRSAARLVGDALAVPASDLGRMLDADTAIRRALEEGATVADLVSAIGPNDWRVLAARMRKAKRSKRSGR
mgnify:FL=1